MLRKIPAQTIQRRPPKPRKPAECSTLVSATWSVSTWVRLTFDRAVNIAGIDVSTVTIADNWTTDGFFGGDGAATMVDAQTVQVPLDYLHSSPGGSGVLLTVTDASGIVAVDDGGTFAGVTDFEVPHP